MPVYLNVKEHLALRNNFGCPKTNQNNPKWKLFPTFFFYFFFSLAGTALCFGWIRPWNLVFVIGIPRILNMVNILNFYILYLIRTIFWNSRNYSYYCFCFILWKDQLLFLKKNFSQIELKRQRLPKLYSTSNDITFSKKILLFLTFHACF